MADIITTLHPEGIPTDNLYPNIKKENLPSDLQPVADFAISEYEKQLNLVNFGLIVRKSFTASSNTSSCFCLELYNDDHFYRFVCSQGAVGFDAVETLSIDGDVYGLRVGLNGNNEDDKTVLDPITLASGDYTFTGEFSTAQLNSYTFTRLMLSKTSSPVPFQQFNGDVMHAVNVEGDKLWENGNPDASFSAQSVTLADNIDNYRYLALYFKINTGTSRASQEFKIKANSGFSAFASLTADTDEYNRSYTLSGNTVDFAEGKLNGSSNNIVMIPVAIYGIK